MITFDQIFDGLETMARNGSSIDEQLGFFNNLVPYALPDEFDLKKVLTYNKNQHSDELFKAKTIELQFYYRNLNFLMVVWDYGYSIYIEEEYQENTSRLLNSDEFDEMKEVLDAKLDVEIQSNPDLKFIQKKRELSDQESGFSDFNFFEKFDQRSKS